MAFRPGLGALALASSGLLLAAVVAPLPSPTVAAADSIRYATTLADVNQVGLSVTSYGFFGTHFNSPSPRLHLKSADGRVDLYWDGSPESVPDPTCPAPVQAGAASAPGRRSCTCSASWTSPCSWRGWWWTASSSSAARALGSAAGRTPRCS